MASQKKSQKMSGMIKEIENSKKCPFFKDLCPTGASGCPGTDWRKCGQAVHNGTIWKRLLAMGAA